METNTTESTPAAVVWTLLSEGDYGSVASVYSTRDLAYEAMQRDAGGELIEYVDGYHDESWSVEDAPEQAWHIDATVVVR